MVEAPVCLLYTKLQDSEKKMVLFPEELDLFLFIHREREKSWFQTQVYEWDPCFQFPSRMIGTIVLAFICLYLVSSSKKPFCFL
jgi:hypothetical protein